MTESLGQQSSQAAARNHRFTGLTNAFSKKFENHIHALALYFMFHNFVRIHKTLKVTAAMAAGISATLWTMEDIAEKVEASRPQPGKRGPYKKRGVDGTDSLRA